MKNKFKILYLFLGIALLFTACKPDEYELGALMDKSALKFTVTPSGSNPNDIILTSLTPNLTPMWVTPYGQSIRLNDTINVPFPGTYKFVYGVESDGGFVQADTTVVTITTLDQNAVSTPMWVNLTGGFGNSKTWVMDLDANGKSKFFTSPFYFGGNGWEWDPNFSDIGWAGVSAGNYGSMTFDLKGDAHFSADNIMFPEFSGTGKFMMYPATNQLATFGAQVIHDKGQGNNVKNWFAKMTIKSLDADHMQLICITADDGSAWLIYNYISQDYYNTH